MPEILFISAILNPLGTAKIGKVDSWQLMVVG
jgi:hypothetical protein